MRRVLHAVALVLALVVAGAVSCEPRATRGGDSQPSPAMSLAPVVATSAAVFPSGTASSINAPLPTVPTEDAVHRHLRTAPMTALTIVSWSRPGLFQATMERPDSKGPVQVALSLALDQHPITYRRPLAFARLAYALGMRVVPATAVRHVSTGELGAFFANDADVAGYLSAHAAVQNDGTIDALVTAPSRGETSTAWNVIPRRNVVLDEAPEVRAWARAVASTQPIPEENAALLRDYIDMLVLDYLSCNVNRHNVLLDDASSELLLIENDGAFPTKIVPSAEAHLLDRLEPVVRFPRTMRDMLVKFDRVRAREVFMPGTFDTWTLSPRTLMLIDERRSSLLTLIESRVAEYGEHAVLSL